MAAERSMLSKDPGVRCKVYILMLVVVAVVEVGWGRVGVICFSCIEQANIMGGGGGGCDVVLFACRGVEQVSRCRRGRRRGAQGPSKLVRVEAPTATAAAAVVVDLVFVVGS